MFDISDAVESFEEVRNAMNSVIGPRNYDEVAIMVQNPLMAYSLCSQISNSGAGKPFNRTSDTVHTRPITTQYDVTYRFIEVVGQPFRLEIMNFTRGVSPAHIPAAERLRGVDEFVIIHVSYKPGIHMKAGLEGYEAEKDILRAAGLEHVQECRSSYGIFSYWLHPDLPPGIYLKPRVNLRDPATVRKVEEVESDGSSIEGVSTREGDPLLLITEEQFIPAKERGPVVGRVDTDTLR